jgi:hypothetical protein
MAKEHKRTILNLNEFVDKVLENSNEDSEIAQ